MKKTIFTTFIFLISINISFSQSKVEDIKEFKLDNGMKILVFPMLICICFGRLEAEMNIPVLLGYHIFLNT
jgi:hypothetical protein